MGIYEERKTYDHRGESLGNETFLEEINPGYGARYIRRHVVWLEEKIQDNCFCCTCGDREGSDHACRNHGSHALRPCEEHNQPGSPWELLPEEEADGVTPEMPESVQVIRKKQAEIDALTPPPGW